MKSFKSIKNKDVFSSETFAKLYHFDFESPRPSSNGDVDQDISNKTDNENAAATRATTDDAQSDKSRTDKMANGAEFAPFARRNFRRRRNPPSSRSRASARGGGEAAAEEL